MLETKDDKAVFEFPPETIKVIDKIGGVLGIESRAEVISRALSLLETYADARKEHRILVERPEKGPGQEYEIDVRPSPA